MLYVVICEDWINEEGRAFPIVVDPTVFWVNGFSTGSWVENITGHSSSPPTGWNSSFRCYTWRRYFGLAILPTDNVRQHATMNITGLSTPDGFSLLSAQLDMNFGNYTTYEYTRTSASGKQVSATFNVTASFTLAGTNPSVGVFNGNRLLFNITSMLLNKGNHNQILFQIPQESQREHSINFGSPTITMSLKRIGLDPNDYNFTQNSDIDGRGIVCLNTGKLNYIYNNVAINDGFMPISISHIYDEHFGTGNNVFGHAKR